ncbi:metal-dependent phosphohydrolase [Agrobacterium phage Atu_ph07]|uniref:Guanosine-3',5'-bis(Diphosphate) n=1 Tax=Agrobacterium phage Atu_ph07 TaxID=2024264 RepID=A0A2L0V0F1_9CAUD|nr:metal-dependent phosphohydrolase [Agrobacterium phage Atu_ph07]AUZ95240.1 guanosine-3',5'-bis(diphosphate) [Agrobacterium phage Atu_ph07]
MKHLLNIASVLAATGHDGQYDKGGNPYLLHVFAVMNLLRSNDEELMCIALLHDYIEDCKYTKGTYQKLRENNMTDRIIDAVRLLTKVPGQTHEEYLEGILTNIDAIRVKKADITNNMDLTRLKGLREKDFERMKKYTIMYAVLDEAEKNWK